MAPDLKELLGTADGGPVAPPDVDAIDGRARRLTRRRAVTVGGVAALLLVIALGIAGPVTSLRAPMVGEPSPPPREPMEHDVEVGRTTGPPRWTTALPIEGFGAFGSGSQVAGNTERVFVAAGYTASAAAVVALERADGEVAWRTELDGAAFVLAATEELLVAHEPDRVVALDAVTGDVVWEHALPVRYRAVSATVQDQTLYLVTGAGNEGDTSPPRAQALDLADGQVRWTSTLAADTDPQWTPPAIVDDLLLVAATPDNPQVETGNRVHALRIVDGVVAWERDLGGRQGFSDRATAVTDGRFHVSAQGVGVVTLEVANGTVVHTIEDRGLLGVAPDGDALYVTDVGERAVVRAVDPPTGASLQGWEPWALADDAFEVRVLGTELLLPSTTSLVAVDPSTGVPRWRHTHETPAYEVLVLDGLLVVANEASEIVATPLPPD